METDRYLLRSKVVCVHHICRNALFDIQLLKHLTRIHNLLLSRSNLSYGLGSIVNSKWQAGCLDVHAPWRTD